MTLLRATVLTACLAATAALAAQPQQVDPATTYDIVTEGSSATVTAGEKAKLVIAIKTKGDAYVSDEAPLRIELSGTNATPAKAKLTLADSVTKPSTTKEGKKLISPVFEVPYTPANVGKATMDAKMTFFICTKDLCIRQQKNLSMPLDVSAAKKAL